MGDTSGYWDDIHFDVFQYVSSLACCEPRVCFKGLVSKRLTVHLKSWVGAVSSLMPYPSLKVSQRHRKLFHVSSLTLLSMVGLVSLGPLDTVIWVLVC